MLKPGGTLLAATNGANHVRELHALIAPCLPVWSREGFDDFTLENGAAQLAPFFRAVTRDDYEDALVVTEAEPLLAYIDSLLWRELLTDDARATLEQRIRDEIACYGAFHIAEETGLFIART